MALPVKPADVPEDLENPVRGEPRGTFAAKANEFLRRLVEDYTPALNAMADWINATAIEIESIASDVSSDADSASTSASNAADILSDVQQIQATLDQDVQINDTTASSTSVYSSEKTEQVALDLIDDDSTAVDKTWSAQKLFDETGSGSTLRATASGDISEKDLVSLLPDGTMQLTQSGGVSDVQYDVVLSSSATTGGIARLTDTSYAILYYDVDETDRNRFAIVDASSSVPVIGASEALVSGSTSVMTVSETVAISSTKFMLISSTSDKAYVIDISGVTSITETAITPFISSPDLRLIDTDKVVLRANVDNTNSYVSILTINPDDTVTEGTRYVVSNSNQDDCDIAIIDSTKFVAVYKAKSIGVNTMRAKVCDVSGSVITVNATESQLRTASFQAISADYVNNHLCVAYYYSTSTVIEVLTASISGNSLTVEDTVAVYDPTTISVPTIIGTVNKNAALLWSDGAVNGGSQAIKVGDDGSISNSGTNIFRVGTVSGLRSTNLGGGKVAASFRDQGGDNSLDTFTANVNGSNTSEWIGFARADALNGEQATASIIGGVVSGLSGLDVNKRYYVDSSTAGLTTVDTGVPVGRATKTTELMITGGF